VINVWTAYLYLPRSASAEREIKFVWLGRHGTEDDAARAYNEAAKKYFGEKAFLNNVHD
jgi:hypothetical protein